MTDHIPHSLKSFSLHCYSLVMHRQILRNLFLYFNIPGMQYILSLRGYFYNRALSSIYSLPPSHSDPSHLYGPTVTLVWSHITFQNCFASEITFVNLLEIIG